MDGHRTRIVAVAILAGAGLAISGGWENAALGSVDDYASSPMVGMNIAGLSNQSTQWTLGDLYLSSGGWDQLAGSTVSYDSGGDPIINSVGQQVGEDINLNNFSNYPTGTYTMTWQGTGLLQLSEGGTSQNYQSTGDSTVTATFTVSSSPGSSLYLIDSYDFLNTGNINGSDPIHNVHLYMPGNAPTAQNPTPSIFTPQFTQGLKPFGTVRFMDAMNTNSDTTAWTSLSTSSYPGPQTTDPKWNSAAGMPVAAMVALANQTNTNPWFNIPANASASYVTQFAQYVKANLNSNLKVYIEYGNEDWSTLNPAGQLIKSQSGGASNGPTFDSNWAADDEAVFKAWENVYTGSPSGVSSQLVRVAALQTSNTYDSPMFLSALHADGGFDAVADAPYFGPTSANIAGYTSSTTASQILNDMIANIQSQASPTGDWTWNMQLAKQYGVPLIGYEGGQGLTPGSTSVAWYQAYLQAEESPEMEQIMEQWLQTYLDQVGGSEVNVYNYVGPISQYSAYGVMEYQDQADAPKYAGLVDFLSGVPEPATLGLLAPAACLLLARRRGAA